MPPSERVQAIAGFCEAFCGKRGWTLTDKQNKPDGGWSASLILKTNHGDFFLSFSTNPTGADLNCIAIPLLKVPVELRGAFLEVVNIFNSCIPLGILTFDMKDGMATFFKSQFLDLDQPLGPEAGRLIERTGSQTSGVLFGSLLPVIEGIAKDRGNPKEVLERVLERKFDPEVMPLSSAMALGPATASALPPTPPSPPPPSAANPTVGPKCSQCAGPTLWVAQWSRYYCNRCQKYA